MKVVTIMKKLLTIAVFLTITFSLFPGQTNAQQYYDITIKVDVRWPQTGAMSQFLAIPPRNAPIIVIYQEIKGRWVRVGRHYANILPPSGGQNNMEAALTVTLYPGYYMTFAEEDLYTGSSIRKRMSYSQTFRVAQNYSNLVQLHIMAPIYSFKIRTGVDNLPIYLTYFDANGNAFLKQNHVGNTGMHSPGELNYEISLPSHNLPFIAQTHYNNQWYEVKLNSFRLHGSTQGQGWNLIDFNLSSPRNIKPNTGGNLGNPTGPRTQKCQHLLQLYHAANQKYNQTHSQQDRSRMEGAMYKWQDCLQREGP